MASRGQRSPLRSLRDVDDNLQGKKHTDYRKHDERQDSYRDHRREDSHRDHRREDRQDSHRDHRREDRQDSHRDHRREDSHRDHRRDDRQDSHRDHRREERANKHPRQDGEGYPPSKHSRFELVPGNQNTTTKEPMQRPPDMRLVTALACKGDTLMDSLHRMHAGPSGKETALQHLTTRDVVIIPDLFSAESGFVMPADPFGPDGGDKTIYQRLVEEIHHASRHPQPQGKGGKGKGGKGGKGDTRPEGDDANGLFKAWHKTTVNAAGDGLADANGRDGNGHLIVNDRDERWQQAQRRGEAPMYEAVHRRIEEYFHMKIQGKRYNHYRDMTNWKPFHHDAAGLDKTAGKGGKGGKGKAARPMCETQNMTVGVSFGEARQAAFEWAGARENGSFPRHLQSPAVNRGSHSNVVLSLTLPDSSTYTFGRDVNLLWKHGILAEKMPLGRMGGQIEVEQGRISIIAWGWVDQWDELDEYLDERTG